MTTYDEIYAAAIAQGATPLFADMLASRKAPGAKTDESLTRGFGTLDKQLEGDPMKDVILGNAMRAGYKPNPNDVYNPMLARFKGDPLGFIPSGAGARNHVKRVAQLRKIDLDGLDTHRYAEEREPEPNKIINDQIAARDIAALRANEKSARKASTKELHQDVVKKYRRSPV